MPFSDAPFDPETLTLLKQALEEAWQEVRLKANNDTHVTREMMALRIMAAANDGELDPKRLKAIAVQSVDGRDLG